MEISYTTPLRRAWQRMKAMLFRPFQLEKWLVVGLAAFVANLMGTGGGLFSWRNNFSPRHSPSPHAEHALQAAHDKLMALLDKPVVLLAIAAGLVVVGVVVLLLAWVTARGRFVFLENVVTGRGSFEKPWRQYGRLGHSLFLWYAAFSFVWVLPVGAIAVPFWPTIESVIRGVEFVRPSIPALLLGGAAAFAMALVLGFVTFLTREFVVPLMMLYDESSSRAWARFWPLLVSHPGDFVACALFAVVVWIGVGVALLVAGVATCCVGLLLMMIPYVCSVVLLPVEVTARAFGPEFLAQFGPEWDLFGSRAERAEETAAPAGPPLG